MLLRKKIMKYPVFLPSAAAKKNFLQFWSQLHFDPNAKYYFCNIGRPLTPKRVRELYFWKNGGKLSERKRRSVELHVVQKLPELKTLDKNFDTFRFLTEFAEGGMIWRIFFLHIWQPQIYPIYDQHVNRAMCFIKYSEIHEIPLKYKLIAQTYVEEYLSFFNLFPPLGERKVDKALWAFGKFLKSPYRKMVNIIQ